MAAVAFNPYLDPFLSMVRFVSAVAQQAQVNGLVATVPSVINLDAHADINELPAADFFSLSGYAMHIHNKLPTVVIGVGISTYNDPNNIRHMKLMDLMLSSLLPETRVPIYTNGNVNASAGVMVVADGLVVDPIDRDPQRVFQVMTVRLLPASALPSGN